MDNTDYVDNDLNWCMDDTDSAEECQRLCQTTKDCVEFTWIGLITVLAGREKECCLKYSVHSSSNTVQGLVSGPRLCSKCYFGDDKF